MKFTKMQGLGNDFVIVDSQELPEGVALRQLAVDICDRHFGVGADGLVVLADCLHADTDMRIFNSDGREAESCGNALRCVAAHISFRKGGAEAVTIAAPAGIFTARCSGVGQQDTLVTVEMGVPDLSPGSFPALVDGQGPVLSLPVSTHRQNYEAVLVRMGVPHVVIFVASLEHVDLVSEGRQIETDPLFPEGANVNFVEQTGSSAFTVKVWERGAGVTLACGTGACAVTVAAVLTGRSGPEAVISLPGGHLDIQWQSGGVVTMRGPATSVFTGEYLRA